MEVAPFFVDFHHFLSIFTIFYRFSRFRHFCRDLHFVAIYALFPQFFFGQNSLLRIITRFLHVCAQRTCFWTWKLRLEFPKKNYSQEQIFFLNTNFPRNRIKTKHCQYLPCMTRRSRGNTTHKYPNINANPEVSHKYSVFALQFDPDSPPRRLGCLTDPPWTEFKLRKDCLVQ